MSANDSKKYYWLKLKKDFFQQHQIRVLKALPNGRLYALIYLELLAESTSHNGELRYSQTLPYDTITLASVIDEDKDNLEKAIETFQRLELVEILEDSTIYMREIERLVGSETGQTIRKREAKLLQGKNYPKITLESRDKSIENRDKNKELLNIIYTEAGVDESTIKDVFYLIEKSDAPMNQDMFNITLDVIANNEICNKVGYLKRVVENGYQ